IFLACHPPGASHDHGIVIDGDDPRAGAGGEAAEVSRVATDVECPLGSDGLEPLADDALFFLELPALVRIGGAHVVAPLRGTKTLRSHFLEMALELVEERAENELRLRGRV